MSISTVPAAYQALFVAAQGALSGRQVVKGAPLDNLKQRYALIGWSDEAPGITSRQTINDYGLSDNIENFDVTCRVVAWTGGADADVVIDQVYGDFNAFTSTLLTDPTLGGTCMLAQLTESGLTVERGNNRTQASLLFVVNIQASRH